MSQGPLADDQYSRSGGAVAGLFSALPFAAMGGALALAPLAGLAALIAAPWSRLARATRAGGLSLALFAAFGVWTMITASWSPHPTWRAAASFAAGGGLFLLVFSSGLARPADSTIARRAGVAGVAGLLILLMVETAFDFPIARALAVPTAAAGRLKELDPALLLEQAKRGAALAAVWVWGGAAMLGRHRWPGWIGMAALFAAVVWLGGHLPSPVILVALAAGAPPALTALRYPRAAVALTASTAALLTMFAPGLLPTLAAVAGQGYRVLEHADPPFPWLARVDTWSYATGMIKERIIQGWGFGASASFTDTHNLAGFTVPYMPGHPQNTPLQIWLETGIVGAVLAAGSLATFGRAAGAALARDRWAAAGAAGAIATAFVIVNVSFNAWALWWWAGLAIAAALVRAARVAP